MAKKLKQDSPSTLAVSGVNLVEVERLLAFMQSHGLEEFEYQDGSIHIRLKKAASQASGQPVVLSAAPAVVHVPSAPSHFQPAAVAAAVAPPISAPPAAAPAAAEDLHVVKSPIVGTFYSSPSPDADPFTKIGSRVETGQVLCIIEAMKLMNEIESDVSGEVVRTFVENGQPVEYGEPLFAIKKK